MDTKKIAVAGISRRDAAKAERRQKILHAARSIIQESSDGSLSMRAIAARAEVSIATPYNLFGSKRAIIQAMLEDVRDFEVAFQDVAAASAVDKIFEALRLTFRYFLEEPEFYKTIWACLLDTESTSDLRAELMPPHSNEFWESLLSQAAKEGDLHSDVDLERLQKEFGKCFSANMLAWVFGQTEVEDLYNETSLGYALLLSGAATDHGRARLSKRVSSN